MPDEVMMSAIDSQEKATLYVAAAADDRGVLARPAVVRIEGGRVRSVERAQEADVPAPGRGGRHDLSECILLPGLVNAHTHLDLTALGCVPLGDSSESERAFGEWLAEVRRRRLSDPGQVGRSVEEGVRRALKGGTAIVGDIVGGDPGPALEVLGRSLLSGIAFIECFGLGDHAAASCARIDDLISSMSPIGGGFSVGWQPHAPYSASQDVFRHCAAVSKRSGVPMATHLAESRAERRFTREAGGLLAERLRSFGLWHDAIRPWGVDPIPGVLAAAAGAKLLAAHVNDVTPDEADLLAAAGSSVIYCPRASAFFGHRTPPENPHPWRMLRAAGVNVALGTDGVVCLDREDRISVLDDARFLLERDQASAGELLSMMTVAGARAMGLPDLAVRLGPEGRTGVIAIPVGAAAHRPDVDPVGAALRSGADPLWVLEPRNVAFAPCRDR